MEEVGTVCRKGGAERKIRRRKEKEKRRKKWRRERKVEQENAKQIDI
jgi:hypothetical protein